MEKPFVYLAFANQTKDEKSEGFLPALREEMQGLKDAFLPFVVNDSIGWMTDENVSAEALATSLPRISTNDKRPKIIHFSGHAGKDYWKLTDGKLDDNQLNNLVFGMKNVSLVFMNACCTEPLRDYFLDTIGVKAVIATSENIKDQEAKDFAIAFYNNLALPGKTLESAFRNACGALKFFPTEDVVVPASRHRGIVRLGANGEVKKSFAWGIYWKDEAAKEWIFNDNLASGIPQGLENVWKEYGDIRQQISEKEVEVQKQIADFEAMLKSQNLPEIAFKFTFDATRTVFLTPLTKLYAEADKMRQALENVDRSAKLKSQIDQFNFSSEIVAITEKYPNLPNGAYILRGKEGCGLGFLSKKIALLLRSFSESYRPLRIDLGGVASGRDGVFNELKRGLKLDKHAAATTLQTLAIAFRENVLALPTNDPFVLIVDNIQNLFDEDLKDILTSFWATLHADLVKNPINRKVILLLLLRIDQEFEETRDIMTVLPTDLANGCVVCLADEVLPVKPEYLKTWCLEKADVFNEWALKSDLFFNKDEPNVVPTLLRMAQTMQSQDLEKYIFDQEGLKFCKI
jgi:hypothetical protein